MYIPTFRKKYDLDVLARLEYHTFFVKCNYINSLRGVISIDTLIFSGETNRLAASPRPAANPPDLEPHVKTEPDQRLCAIELL